MPTHSNQFEELKEDLKRRREKPSLQGLEAVYLKLQSFNHMAEPSIPFQFRSRLPSITGVYFLYVDSTIYYTGQAQNIVGRWKEHDVLDKLALASETVLEANARIGWIECPKHLLNFVEIYLIGLLRPILNIAHNHEDC